MCDFRFACYASRQCRQDSADLPLAEKKWCTVTGSLGWFVPTVWKKRARAEQQVVFASGSTLAVMTAVAEGMGVCMMPCYDADADPRVVRVTPPFEAMTLKLWLLTHQDLRHTARVKALLAFMHDELTARASLFEGNAYAE